MNFLKKVQFKLIQKVLETNEKLVFDKRVKKTLKGIFNATVNTVFDVGANKGQSIELFLKWFPKAQIYSFEPNPKLFSKLCKKYGNNPRINLFQMALSDQNGEMIFYENLFDSSSTLEVVNPNSNYLSKKTKVLGVSKQDLLVDTYPVQVKKLSNIIQELGLSTIDFIKIDVEGHELNCLRGLFADLTANINAIQIEAQSNDLYDNAPNFNIIQDLFKSNQFNNSASIKHGFGGFSDIIYWKA